FPQILSTIENNISDPAEEVVARRHKDALNDDVIPWLDTMSTHTKEFLGLTDIDSINKFFTPTRDTRWFDAGWFGAMMDYFDSEIDPIAALDLNTLSWTKP